MRSSRRLLLCLGALMMLAAAACSSQSSPSPSSSKGTHVTAHLTHAQAAAQAHKYMDETLSAFPQGTGLTPVTADVDAPCSDDDGAPASTPVVINAASRLTGVDAGQLAGVLTAFVSHWKGRGWRVQTDERPKSQYVVMRNGDGYELSVDLNEAAGTASLGASTPCVPPKDATSSGG